MNKQTFLQRFYHKQPVHRERDFPLPKPGRPAAVLIPIVERPRLSIILTRRAAHLKHHASQISFPGGRFEATDRNLQHTSLRETEEEIGLSPSKVRVLGQLPPYRTISGYQVVPFVGLVKPPFELEKDPNEVESIFEVPLEYVMDLTNHHPHWIERGSDRHTVYFIPWKNTAIWGATAAFIRNLAHHLAD
ncbi:putative Nudix hydrolase NudL [Saliniradius amylolyticus]|uniref:Putative Nudix hydrolase NudL n=1 Tax=Saliniradius amylolyticus TaxID=2183582 RepID=A0A2S2E3M4_9ALTE|nr:CoA pyrophosphatase [Saliniradius amylolyticus]AWL12256.1 putative Nudix hydrolase NudL [Saliniradius amylolyticus]